MAIESDEHEWRNARNWRGGWFQVYVAPRDRRLLVPTRRRGLGWTPNYGRRATWLAMLALYAAMAAGVVALGAWAGWPDPRRPPAEQSSR